VTKGANTQNAYHIHNFVVKGANTQNAYHIRQGIAKVLAPITSKIIINVIDNINCIINI
jgi:hypothetical protein